MFLLCENQKQTIINYAVKFDGLITRGQEGKISKIIQSYNNTGQSPHDSQPLIDFFFIWIGQIKPCALEYIDIWQEALGQNGKITIYFDSHFFLFNHYASQFKSTPNTNTTSIEKIIQSQNKLKNEIDNLVNIGHSFDQAFIIANNRQAPTSELNLEQELAQTKEYFSKLNAQYNLLDIRTDLGLFFDDFFYKIYFLELTLRANGAAAADILRLLILYRRGGVYVDVDTLPSLVPVYGPITSTANCNIQNVVRSAYFIQRRRQLKNINSPDVIEISEYEDYLNQIDERIVAHIKFCASQLNHCCLPTPLIKTHKNLITMAALETPYEYNNNLLASVQKSKSVMIILREIKKRYNFIFKHGFDKKQGHKTQPEGYLSRLNNYRYDTLNEKDNVTLFLTGPILILEVMLGIAYEVLPLDKSIRSLALSYALRLNCISFACTSHTSYTPEHIKSSWM